MFDWILHENLVKLVTFDLLDDILIFMYNILTKNDEEMPGDCI